jgi:hypothetical protein
MSILSLKQDGLWSHTITHCSSRRFTITPSQTVKVYQTIYHPLKRSCIVIKNVMYKRNIFSVKRIRNQTSDMAVDNMLAAKRKCHFWFFM